MFGLGSVFWVFRNLSKPYFKIGKETDRFFRVKPIAKVALAGELFSVLLIKISACGRVFVLPWLFRAGERLDSIVAAAAGLVYN